MFYLINYLTPMVWYLKIFMFFLRLWLYQPKYQLLSEAIPDEVVYFAFDGNEQP